MTSSEHSEYNRLTDNMEADFLVLGDMFMGECENIIFGGDNPDLKYFCFHLFNDNYTKTIFSKLSFRIEKLFSKTDAQLYPNLSAGFGNLLIYLKEPILRENDAEYKAENYLYWRNEILKDNSLAHNGSFRKYLVVI